jgi:Ca2+-binding EF-hand superfamily protein
MKAPFLLPVLLLICAMPVFAELPGMDTLAGLVINQFDRDHDGNVDINEWQNGTNDGFIEMDKDQDGFISESEIDALADPISEEIGKLGAAASVVLIKKILFTFDTDHDRRISKSEYETGCASLFKLLDSNHDGLITKAELADLPLRLFQRADKK